MALSKTTKDHDEIRKWAESRGAVPAEVASTETEGEVGILRLEFPNAKNSNDSALKEISWDDFFAKFDSSGLALVYQEQTADGEASNFNKLIHSENDSSSSTTKSAARKPAAKKTSSKSTSSKSAKSTSAKSSSASSTSSKAAKTPAKKSSAKKSATSAPAKKAAAKKAPAKKTPAKKAPAKKVPAKKAPPAKKAARR